MAENIEITSIKVGLLGDGKVGKSAICNAFIGVDFMNEAISTIGFEKFEKKLKMDDGKEIKLVLWDTAGQERFRSAAFKTIRSVQGIALVFDVTFRDSFDNVEKWLDDIKDNLDNPSLVLLGNKIDLPKDQWQVKQDEIDELCKQKKLQFFATSAKENKGITEAFNFISNTIYKKLENKKPIGIVIENKKKNNIAGKNKCC